MKVLNLDNNLAYFGQAAMLVLEFRVDGLIVTPDDGSVSYSLHSASAELIPETSVALGETTVTIDNSHHVQVGDQLQAPRFIRLTFKEDGVTRYVEYNYSVVSFLPITVTPEDVRLLLGVSDEELPDLSISLRGSYYAIRRDLEQDIFSDELLNYEANQLVLFKEAITQAKTLNLKALQAIKTDDISRQRSRIDFKEIVRSVEAGYLEHYRIFDSGIPSEPILQILKSRADPITGA